MQLLLMQASRQGARGHLFYKAAQQPAACLRSMPASKQSADQDSLSCSVCRGLRGQISHAAGQPWMTPTRKSRLLTDLLTKLPKPGMCNGLLP